MNPVIEILLGAFLFAWLLKGIANFIIGLLQIVCGIIGTIAVLIWTLIVAAVSLPMLFLPKKRTLCA